MEIKCCPKMINVLNEGQVIEILDNIPFTKVKDEPKAYIISDGGHGGMENIVYCPFCGTKIKII